MDEIETTADISLFLDITNEPEQDFEQYLNNTNTEEMQIVVRFYDKIMRTFT